jgi:hypothetical protein
MDVNEFFAHVSGVNDPVFGEPENYLASSECNTMNRGDFETVKYAKKLLALYPFRRRLLCEVDLMCCQRGKEEFAVSMADGASSTEVVPFEYDGPSRLLSEVWPVWHPDCKTSREPSYLWMYTIEEETTVKDVCETFGLNLPQFVAYNDDSVQDGGSVLHYEDAVKTAA